MTLKADAGSFRDTSGRVFHRDNRVFRTVTERGRAAYEATRSSPIIGEMERAGRLVASEEVPPNSVLPQRAGAAYVLEHWRVPLISYPYEWSFRQLQAAALHHLDLQLDLLNHGLKLSDASAYNIQFVGSQPIFIDRLSIVPYVEGELWLGHRQFCDQFLNPLLLRTFTGVAHNAWFRGSLEGIPARALAPLVPMRRRLSWNVLTHVIMQAKLDATALESPGEAIRRVQRNGRLSRAGFEGILRQLRSWIAHLHPADDARTTWGDYAKKNTYTSEEAAAKHHFIAKFVADRQPHTIIDLGCNTGDYSITALENGAGYAIGFDFDQVALDGAYARAREHSLRFLPLWLDAANPSPDQGWRQCERSGFSARAKSDALIALAFEHHLAIAKNVPLDEVVSWLINIAPHGVIEFVPKGDPTVQRMLALREDIFDDYTAANFEAAVMAQAAIVRQEPVSKSGRTLYQYARL